MKNKKFNIDEARTGAPIVTRDGRKVKFIAYVPEANYPVIALIDGTTGVETFSDAGYWRGSDLHPEPEDLFIAVPTKTVYVNLYPGSWNGFETAKQAHDLALDDVLSVAIPVEINL